MSHDYDLVHLLPNKRINKNIYVYLSPMTLTWSEGHDILMGRKIMAQLFTHPKLTSVSVKLSEKLLFIGFGQGDYSAGRALMHGCNSQKN